MSSLSVKIPQELTVTVFGYLNSRELCRAGATCKALRGAAGEFFRQLGDELEQVGDSASKEYNRIFASEGRTPVEVLQGLKAEYLTKVVAARALFRVPNTQYRLDRHQQELLHLFDTAQNDQARMRLASFLRQRLPTFDTQAADLDDFAAFIAQEKLTQRFLQASRSIPKLYASQKEAADVALAGRTMFLQLKQNPSVESFCAAETFILERIGQIRDNSLDAFSTTLRYDHSVALQFMAAPQQIRGWLRSPPTELDRNSLLAITSLRMTITTSGFVVSDEICHLKNLKLLELTGSTVTQSELSQAAGFPPPPDLGIAAGVTTLPDTLSELSLSQLVLCRNPLQRLPPVLARMPFIEYLDIREPQYPIAVLPDDIARAQCTGFTIHGYRFLGSCSKTRVGEDWGQFRDYVGLDPRHLTDVPFFIWFRDTFSLPYLPYHLIMDPLIAFVNQGGSLTRQIGNNPCLFFWIEIFFVLIMLGSASFGGLFMLLNTPILLANIAINGIIEPLVTLSRDLLGYSRMVHLRDPVPVGAA
ncbi:MAG: F-box protein [Chlamydiales bacterium]|nr:F-box protein [Chlamydiales bacterium]